MSIGCESRQVLSCKSDCKKNCNIVGNSEVVACFIKNHRDKNKKELERFKGLNLEELLQYDTLYKTRDGTKQYHQRRIPAESLKNFAEKLLTKEADLRTCSDFQGLIDVIKKVRIKWIGELAVYDTALRIGANLGLSPEKVYLHRGTREGAKAIYSKNGKKPFLEKKGEDLPEAFWKLAFYEIEDCLCICKGALSNAGRRIPS